MNSISSLIISKFPPTLVMFVLISAVVGLLHLDSSLRIKTLPGTMMHSVSDFVNINCHLYSHTEDCMAFFPAVAKEGILSYPVNGLQGCFSNRNRECALLPPKTLKSALKIFTYFVKIQARRFEYYDSLGNNQIAKGIGTLNVARWLGPLW